MIRNRKELQFLYVPFFFIIYVYIISYNFFIGIDIFSLIVYHINVRRKEYGYQKRKKKNYSKGS